MPQLVLPSDQYKASFLQAVREYQADKLPYYLELSLEELERDFPGYLTKLTTKSDLPHTTYWLVEGDDFIGRVDIKEPGGHISYDVRPTQRRKGFGKLLLQLGLEQAKALGFKEVLVTCDVANISSNKIIQSNGGVLKEVEPMGTGKPDKVKYSISL